MSIIAWIAGISLLLTFSIFLANVIYRVGHISARVEELEKWRSNMRSDMHEISDKMETISSELQRLYTLVDERTERRLKDRL